MAELSAEEARAELKRMAEKCLGKHQRDVYAIHVGTKQAPEGDLWNWLMKHRPVHMDAAMRFFDDTGHKHLAETIKFEEGVIYIERTWAFFDGAIHHE